MNEYAGVPLAAEQKQLTPLQRMIVVKEAARQKEEAEKQTDSPGRGGPTMNSAQTGGGRMTGETVEYVNEGAD